MLSLLGVALIFGVLPWIAWSQPSRQMLYAEEAGIVEQVSLLLWLGLAPTLLLIFCRCWWKVLAAAVLCVFAAGREAGWHKEFTGGSVLKISYYYNTDYPLEHRLLAGLTVACGVICFGIICHQAYQHFIKRKAYQQPWGQLLIIFVVVGIGTKLLDRAPAISKESLGWVIPGMAREMMQSLEEGMEMFLPVLAGVAAWACVRGKRPPPAPPRDHQAPAPRVATADPSTHPHGHIING